MATLSHFSFFFLPGKPFSLSLPFKVSPRSYCRCNPGCCLLFNGPQLSTCQQQRGKFVSTGTTKVTTGHKVVELPFPPPDVRTRHVVEFVQDRLIVCGGGESWQGPFHASCYQVLTRSFSPQFSFLVEPKLHGMDCFRARGSIPSCECQQW